MQTARPATHWSFPGLQTPSLSILSPRPSIADLTGRICCRSYRLLKSRIRSMGHIGEKFATPLGDIHQSCLVSCFYLGLVAETRLPQRLGGTASSTIFA